MQENDGQSSTGVRAVVMLSGGLGSWAAGRRWIDEHGPDGVVLLFTDTNGEDPDLYRFLGETAANLGAPLITLDNDGKTIWDVFRKARMIGNTRLSVCSRVLKQRPARQWVDAHAPGATVVMGIDWSEAHRAGPVIRNWAPHPVAFPLIDSRVEAEAMLAAAGIDPPRLYALGFPHNNCAGACVRAGQGQWARLLETNPERYAEEERQEKSFRVEIGKDVSILRDRRGGTTTALTLGTLRRRIEGAPETVDWDDLGGCGCMADLEPDTESGVVDADDLFSGAGGWDVGARALGIRTRGYEMNASAVATARAAGFEVVEGDVRKSDPADSYAEGLIGSPPCTSFSMAGKGAGRRAMPRLLESMRTGWWYPEAEDDPTTALVLEPWRWIATRHALGRPYRWIAFEQVKEVLPVWDAYAEMLRPLGYSVATGKLTSEMFGVGQTRVRAILIARLDGEAKLPVPTHSKFYFRDPSRLDPGVLPWVSMAQALAPLGWNASDVVRSNYRSGGDPANRGERAGDQPAATVTTKVGRNYRTSTMPNATVRSSAQPAPTIAFGNDAASAAWVLRSDNRPNSAVRPATAPAPTILGNGERGAHAKWGRERPATTVNGDARISRPGRHDPAESGSQQRDAIRVSVIEAAVLQSFPPDHPWQGTSTSQYAQVGNAVPPLLAEAVLRSATS